MASTHQGRERCPILFAKSTKNTGTGASVVIVADRDHDGWLQPISPITITLLGRMISAGGHGLRLASLDSDEQRAVSDEIEGALHIRLRRARKPGFVLLANSVDIVDQRTLIAEAA